MKELNRIHLSGLRAVEAVGRLGSLKAAADEMGVTIGAVSQQVLRTEEALGHALFVRSVRGMATTRMGADVVTRLSVGMSELAAAIRVTDNSSENRLVVSVAPVFASRWLVWRLNSFHQHYPSIRIRIDPDNAMVDPDSADVDVCVRVGRGGWTGVTSERLLEQRVFPVASPALAANLKSLQDLRTVPVIRESAQWCLWDLWLEKQGLDNDILGDGPLYADASLCLDAAMAGQGVFLAWETLACDALEAGRLVAPFAGRVETGNYYWSVTSERGAQRENVIRFTDWLRAELASSVSKWRRDTD